MLCIQTCAGQMWNLFCDTGWSTIKMYFCTIDFSWLRWNNIEKSCSNKICGIHGTFSPLINLARKSAKIHSLSFPCLWSFLAVFPCLFHVFSDSLSFPCLPLSIPGFRHPDQHLGLMNYLSTVSKMLFHIYKTLLVLKLKMLDLILLKRLPLVLALS